MADHDRLFKELLTTFFVEFVDLFLPDVSEYLEHDSLEFLDKELFTDVTSGERHEADVVVRARFRGEDAFCQGGPAARQTRMPSAAHIASIESCQNAVDCRIRGCLFALRRRRAPQVS